MNTIFSAKPSVLKIYDIDPVFTLHIVATRSRLDRSVELLYKRWNSILVGWHHTQNGNQSCSWGRGNVNTDRPQLQLHRVLLSRGISQFTLLHYWAGLNMSTIHLCWCLWHHPTRTHLQAVQHSYLIYSCSYKCLQSAFFLSCVHGHY